MALVARTADGSLISSLDDGAGVTPVCCPDPKCGAKLHWVRPLLDDHGYVARCAYFRHSVGSGCPHGSARGGDRMTPWHVAWQLRCDDLARLEVVVERGETRSRADTVCKDGATAVEYQHSGLDQGTITRRENVWRGRVIWVLDSGSEDRAGEATLSDRLRWTSTAGLHRRLFRGVVFVDIGDNKLIELPRTGVLPSASLVDIPAAAVRVWTHDQFVDQVVNGDELPFDFDATQWAIEAREKAAQARRDRSPQERAQDREKARQARVKREREGGIECEYTGDDRDRLVMPEAVEAVDASADVTVVKTRPKREGHPCRGCGELGQAKAASWCERCWQTRIESMVAPLSITERRTLRGVDHRTNPRATVVEAIADLDRQARHA